MVSGKTGCSSWLRVNQYKPLCAFSLSLNSLISVLFFGNWYKQSIVSANQPIFFLVLCLFALCVGKLNSGSSISRSNFIIYLKFCENPL